MSTLTMTDMFCGAGGSSTGAIAVPGIEVRTAMNHWARAIETHNTNHPDTDHVQADISQVDPRLVNHSDILWASPECTNHSSAKGQKRVTGQGALFGDRVIDPAAERSRATMWDVPRFAEYHDYRLIITENVVEAGRWVMFDAWLHAMHSLGYEHHIVYLNSMHAQLGGDPAPQSRDRMYVFFWKGIPRPDFELLRPMATCATHGVVRGVKAWKNPEKRWGRYGAQYTYRCPHADCDYREVTPATRPAATVIDWNLRGTKIGERTRPLATKTLARIQAGLDRYGRRVGPLIVNHVSGSDVSRSEPAFHSPLRSIVAGGMHESVLVPDGVDLDGLIVTLRGTAPEQVAASSRPVMEPMTTVTAGGMHHALVTRHFGATHNPAHLSKPASEPLGTLTGSGNQSITTWVESPPKIEECEFRMLEPYELTWGMAFPRDYVMTGNKREQVKQAGNAVTPPAARDLLMVGTMELVA
ncbi:DNA cytosine methyltransferase [Flaviflexus equikiangi]|uniref:DNA (cytosine-5-)-methyltransferase n=1 Tax=Flaviflexus equikiangi TaxID=2758573 RepID=A0ABS2TGF4_9ACTO|nr:DNA cytosine methyltransferase [Flaviflexus equikiangi]MBM9432359.1 DNA cytosine methyltransferase [Flaviflexus equikiangi]